MAISRKKKEELVAQYADLLSRSQVSICTDYSGLNVAMLSELRDQLRKQGAEIHVTKNTLLKRATEKSGLPMPEEFMTGPTAVTFLNEAIAGPTKVLMDFARTNKEFVIKGGITSNAVLTAAQISELASLPSREILLAQVLGGLQAPITGLVNVLAGTLRSLLYVLKARAEQLEQTSS